jgi:flagellar basal-body rod protein FlgB
MSALRKLCCQIRGGTEVAMLSSLFQSSTLPALEQVVKFTEARHGVLAGNIANLDTPGYRTRDLSPELFQERLKDAIETRHQPAKPNYQSEQFGIGNTHTSQPNENDRLTAFEKVEDSMTILRHDDGDVSMEQQVSEIVKNQQQHNLAISIMSAQFRLLKAAITERVA